MHLVDPLLRCDFLPEHEHKYMWIPSIILCDCCTVVISTNDIPTAPHGVMHDRRECKNCLRIGLDA